PARAPARSAITARRHLRPHLAELIVLGALVRLGQHVVGFLDLLELLFGLLIAWIQVGVMLARQLPIRFLYVFLGCIPSHPQDLIVIFSVHASSPPTPIPRSLPPSWAW